MENTKKYFWLKLKDNFFDEKYIKALRKLPSGDSLVIVYLKMQLKSLKTEGIIKYEKILPNAVSELALFLDEDENIVKLTISALIKFGLVEQWDDESFYINSMQQLIGSETAVAERVRKHRLMKAQKTLQNDEKMLPSNTVETKCNTDIDIDIDIDKDKEKEKSIKEKNAELDSFFESVWELYPKKTNKAQIRKATKERLFKIGYEKIALCIDRYKQELEFNHTDYQYIKAGSTFFNGGYEDYMENDWHLPQKVVRMGTQSGVSQLTSQQEGALNRANRFIEMYKKERECNDNEIN